MYSYLLALDFHKDERWLGLSLPFLWASPQMKEQGIRFEVEEEEEEDWDDILEDLDDPWMREPAPGNLIR